MLQVRRYETGEGLIGDMIYDELHPRESETIIDPFDPTHLKTFPSGSKSHDLLEPCCDAANRSMRFRPLAASQRRAIEELDRLHPSIKRLKNPHLYPVGLEKSLHDRRTRLVMHARGLAA